MFLGVVCERLKRGQGDGMFESGRDPGTGICRPAAAHTNRHWRTDCRPASEALDMARKRHSAADDLLASFARLPWWLGVLAAVVAWIGFRQLTIGFAGSTRPHHRLLTSFAGLAWRGVPRSCDHVRAVHRRGPPVRQRQRLGRRHWLVGPPAACEGRSGSAGPFTGPGHGSHAGQARCCGTIADSRAHMSCLRASRGAAEGCQRCERRSAILGLRQFPGLPWHPGR